MNFLYSSLFILLALVVLIIYYISLNKDSNIRGLIQDKSEFAIQFGKSLDILILKKEFESIENIKAKLPLEENLFIQDYQILLFKQIDDYTFLIQVQKNDYEIAVGKHHNYPIPINAYLYFKLFIDKSHNVIEIYSDLFTDNFNKGWRCDFAKNLSQYLHKSSFS